MKYKRDKLVRLDYIMSLSTVKVPIEYAFPVRSMQQVYSKYTTEEAPLKNARIWRVRSPHAVLLVLPQCSTSSYGERSVGVAGMECTKDLIPSYREHPTLWNVKLPAYKDRNLKEIAYDKIRV